MLAALAKTHAAIPSLGIRPKPAIDADRELIKEVAKDIGVEVADHLRRMYPAAFNANPDTFRVSIRNGIYNEIVAALDLGSADDIRKRLDRRKAQRKELARLQNVGKQAVLARGESGRDAVYLSEKKVRAAAEAHCTTLRIKSWKDHSEAEKDQLCEAMVSALAEYLGSKWK